MTPSEKQSRDFLFYYIKDMANERKPIHRERPFENAEDYLRRKSLEERMREQREELEKNPKYAGSSFLMEIFNPMGNISK